MSKHEYTITIKVKNCEQVFDEELGPGVLGKQTIVFDHKPNGYVQEAGALVDYAERFLLELVDIKVDSNEQN